MSPVSSVTLERLDSRPLAVVRHQAAPQDLSRIVPESCGFVWNVLKAQHVRGGRHVAIYWDDRIQVDVGAEVDVPFADASGVVHGATPSGEVAWTTHLGPYGGLGVAHAVVKAWCSQHGWAPTGPRWEIYGHWLPDWSTNPSLIRTDVFYQVRRT
jgi:hypothetical protein